jgi:adenosylcobinamide kinase/adenosylcobinamide-phosphate guanylyltransferase
MKELVLGGARSGKSAYAQRRAAASGLPVTVIVTGSAGDAEMAERIAHHQAARPDGWRVVEAPLALAATLRAEAAPGRCIVVDCLTLWLTNFLAPVDAGHDLSAAPPQAWRDARAVLLSTLPALPGEIILVANEVGLGIVPLGSLARLFRDEAGRLNQDVAAACERATFVAAGLPLALKTPQHC